MKQRLAAILAADAAGYSRLMSADERGTVAALDAARAMFRSHIESNQGRVIDMAGDSVLAVFETAAGALNAALQIQSALAEACIDIPMERRMLFRIGIHSGDVMEKADGSIYGDGVNIAARLQALAEPGGVTVSESIHTAVRGKVAATFIDQGEQTVKNIAHPVRALAVKPEATSLASVTGIDFAAPVPGFGGRPAIAVLPFDNLSGDPEQEYFADGLAEDILTRLAMWRWVPVIARNSSFAFKGRAVDVKAVGKALGARYVLEGSVRKSGNRVRVTGQLIDTETGHHLWAERYDRVLEDIFVIQDELTDGIVGALESAVGRAETERAHFKAPSSLDAWDICQRAMWHLWQSTRGQVSAAEPLFRRAAELDPSLAPAQWGLAWVRLYQVYFAWSSNPAQSLSEAVVHARAALAVDGLDPYAHIALGAALAFTGSYDDGLAYCEKGVQLNPSSAISYAILGLVHMTRGEGELGIRALETTMRISPNDLLLTNWLSILSVLQYLVRNYERAADLARMSVQRTPGYAMGWLRMTTALGQLGRLDEARVALAQFLTLSPGHSTEKALRISAGFRDEAVFQHYVEGLRKAGWTG